MDPISQGVVGATLPQAVVKNNSYMKYGLLFGCLGGMAPDLDVIIRSQNDSLLFLEFHRQFTHSLIFIPLGGLICALLFHFLFRKPMPFKLNYIYTTLGFATHGLLDACTSYGTQLFWPFSNLRVSWNNVSIIDPLFTLPLIALILLSLRKGFQHYGKVALIYGLCYLSFGALQRERALKLGQELAKQRDLKVERIVAKPSIANVFLWKTICETKDKFYVDAVRVAFTEKVYEGESLDKLNVERDFPWIEKGKQQEIDIERFRWFSNNYLAKDPKKENFIIDVRYSIVPNQITGLWGIRLFRDNQDQHVIFESARERSIEVMPQFLEMLFD